MATHELQGNGVPAEVLASQSLLSNTVSYFVPYFLSFVDSWDDERWRISGGTKHSVSYGA